MLYAKRNTQGQITSITSTPSDDTEAIDNNDHELKKFFSLHNDDFTPDSFLNNSDIGNVRILDDLVDLLVRKNVIMFTELPAAAQKKLLSRRLVRSLIQDNSPETSIADTPFLLDEDKLL